MLRSFRRETASNVINFGCIDYDSLVEYCKTFGLHRFDYQYHYDLAQSAPATHSQSTHSAAPRREDAHSKRLRDTGHGDGARIRRDSKREVDVDEGGMEEKVQKKRGRKSKKMQRKDGGTEHHYFNSDLLDRHYERRPREGIPKTFDPATRLTKSELVAVVREHFLATPLLADLNEIDVFQQFLRFIVDRRNKLKKELVDVRK